MSLFQKKSPFTKEWETLQKKENKFLQRRQEKKDSFLNQKLEEKVPDKMQQTLNSAFAKAFTLIFEKGMGVIEKTYKKEEIENQYKINQYADRVKQSKKTLKAFSKKAGNAGNKNLLISGAAGIGMGVLGVGIPDIPVFTAMILKNIYEIALNYGYEYESEREKYFILLLIQGAVSFEEDIQRIDEAVDSFIDMPCVPAQYQQKMQIEQTAAALSKELLYMKFLQGIPVVGAVGGAYDAVYMKRINEYAGLKYKKRFLKDYHLGKKR